MSNTWDIYADTFESFDEYNHFLDDFFDLLGDIEGRKILDLGCSNGLMCRLLAKRGARMVGVDRSREAIDIAKRREIELRQGIDYHVADAMRLDVLADNSFDAIIAVNVLCSLGDVRADLRRAIAEIHRKLAAHGVLVAVIPHPAFEHCQHGSTRRRTFPEGYSYFDSGANNVLDLSIGQQQALINNTHWKIEDYVSFFAGRFVVGDIREPAPDERFLALHEDIFPDGTKFPIYMLMKADKIVSNG